MEIRNRGKRRCQFKDGDSILHNDRISGDNNPRSGGDVKVQINNKRVKFPHDCLIPCVEGGGLFSCVIIENTFLLVS